MGDGGKELGEGRLGSWVRFLRCWLSTLYSPTGGFQKLLLDPLMKFHFMLKKLQLHKEEYVLMQAISLFSPGDGFPPAAGYLQRSAGGSSNFFCPPQGRSQPLALLYPTPTDCRVCFFPLVRWLAGSSFLLGWNEVSFVPPRPAGTTMPCLPPSDRPGVVQRSVVDQLQERFALTLKAYIECSRPYPAHR